jgi:hypothetical protein
MPDLSNWPAGFETRPNLSDMLTRYHDPGEGFSPFVKLWPDIVAVITCESFLRPCAREIVRVATITQGHPQPDHGDHTAPRQLI